MDIGIGALVSLLTALYSIVRYDVQKKVAVAAFTVIGYKAFSHNKTAIRKENIK